MKNRAGALMVLWAVGWGIAGLARLIDGPRIALFSGGDFPFGAWQYVETSVGLLIAIAVGWAGGRLLRRRPGAGKRAIWALAAFVAYAAIILVTRAIGAGGWHEWLWHARYGNLLSNMICAGAMLWFIATSLAAPEDEQRRIPRVVDLALLILVGREALPFITAPGSVASVAENLGMLTNMSVHVALGAIGTIIGMAVTALALARIVGARIIAPATTILLTASLFYAFILLGTQAYWQAYLTPGVASRLSLYAALVVTLIERGMLIAAIEGKQRER